MPRNNFGKTKNKNARRLAVAGDITNTFFGQNQGNLLPDPQPIPPATNPTTMSSGQPANPPLPAASLATQLQLPQKPSLWNYNSAKMGSVIAVKSVVKRNLATEIKELIEELKMKKMRDVVNRAAMMEALAEADKRAMREDTAKKKAKGKGPATCEYATKKAGTKKLGKVKGPAPTGKGVFLPGFAERENPHRGKSNFGKSGGWMGELEQMMAMGMKK